MDNSAHPQSTQSAPHGGVEPSDASFKGVVFFLVGLAIAGILIHIGLGHMFRNLQEKAKQSDRLAMREQVVPAIAASHTYFPNPREQFSPRLDLQALRAQEDAELKNYGWIDKKAGVVRIPIDRAMELMGQRGLPGSTNAGNRGPSSLQLQQQRPIQSSPPSKEEGR
jgi:hypothetical protein